MPPALAMDVNKGCGDQAPLAPAVSGKPLVGAAAWAAVAAAVPAVPTRRVPVPAPMEKSASSNPESVPIGRNLVNQGSAAAGVNSGVGAAAPGNVELAQRVLGSRGITKIKCHTCKKHKDWGEYSHRQLINYKDSIYNEYAPGGRCKTKTASCKDCINGVVTHLDCHVCGVTKPLAKFMKTQRRIPDRARCKRCVQLHLDTERVGEVEDPDDYESDDSDEDGDEDVDFPNATGSATCLVEGNDDEGHVGGGMTKAIGQINTVASSTPYTTDPSTMTRTAGPGNTRGRSSASTGGSTTPASTSGGSASVAGSVTTTTIMSDEWAFVSAAGKVKNYGKNTSTAGASWLTVGAPGYTTPATAGTATTAARRVGGWVKEKAKPPMGNEWGACVGGQPRLFKKKQDGRKNNGYEDNLDEDDGEEI